MSGICGIVRFDEQSVKQEEIQNMLDAMKNRGNDSEGVWIDGNMGFGHKMLWTTPESLHESQPLVNHSNHLIITADARIDNRGELLKKLEIDECTADVITDIDIILWSYEKWGEQCPKYFLGDFIFAIFDKRKQKLFFAKDHIGIRPFYYYIDKHFFCFASEILVIFSISSIERLQNDCAIETFIGNTTLSYEETFFKNIKRLPPAHRMILDADNITLSRYWFPEQLKINKDISFEEATKKFKMLLQEAVYTRLRSAYPIGCELSGGLDSSSILCMAANISREKRIIPFSQRYGNLDCDESYYSDIVAESLKMNIKTVRVDKLDYKKEYSLKNYFYAFPDWPTYGSFMGLIPIAKKAQKENIRILLTGQGGDHIVAGNLYILADYLKAYKFDELYRELKYYKWSKKIIKSYVIKPILPNFIFKFKDFITLNKRKKIVFPNNVYDNENFNIKFPTLSFKEDLDSIIGTFNAFWGDSTVYHNIEKFNIESRHPFFDIRLIEFCLSLPEEYKLKYGISKRILKEAMREIVPEPILSRNDKAEFSEAVEIQLMAEEYTKQEGIDQRYSKIHYSLLNASVKLGIFKWKKYFIGQRMKKTIYKQPTLIKMGRIIKETQGMNGSSVDGNGSLTQSGGGND